MQIAINDPVGETYLFIAFFLVALLVTMRKRISADALGIATTQELKGFAILAIVFAHIGYYLVADHRFLFPLSTLAGVGVDLFLFVSGFGLSASAFSKELSIGQFYRRRLEKIYVPLWLTLSFFFLLDFLVLGITYGWGYIARSMLGWFPHADLYSDVNSPLWYITLIVFYYLLFPFIFSKRAPLLSAFGIFAVTCAITWWTPAPLSQMMPLYQLHIMAFPLGMIAASLARGRKFSGAIKNTYLYSALIVALSAAAAYLMIHSGVGKVSWIAEGTSIVTTLFIMALFVAKRFEIRLLSIFGLFSFEIYLMHWPLLYRYDIFFTFLPPALALAAYLVFFLGLGWLLHRVCGYLFRLTGRLH